MRALALALALLTLGGALAIAQEPKGPDPKGPEPKTAEPKGLDGKNAAVTPVPREGRWVERHQSCIELAKKGDIDLVFLGDAATQMWEREGKDVWEKYYGKKKAANFGIGGDRTQHVLWRVENGALEGISPKVIVLLVGTNNSNANDHTAGEIAAGIESIVHKLNEKAPKAKVLIMAILPRGEKPNPQREKNAAASLQASKLADGKRNFYLDLTPKLLSEDGTLARETMPDFVHLSAKGYMQWAEAIEPQLSEWLPDEPGK